MSMAPGELKNGIRKGRSPTYTKSGIKVRLLAHARTAYRMTIALPFGASQLTEIVLEAGVAVSPNSFLFL
ncbi:MAG: hypothetical protein HC772_02415 [Leptolyngbyaceae cyanobacterium CRU_2_3]|nr:hypothetical protein [Leptolyngbyaceae cyanobacterium CRU_2_3]